MSKFWQIYAWGTIILAFVLLMVVGYWMFYPYNPLEIKSEPMKVLTPQVKAKDSFFFEIDYCKNMDLPAEITRTLIDTVIYNIPSFTANNELGCHKIIATAEIPNIPTGTYYYRIKFDYEVNPIRHILIVAETETFEIVK